MVEAMWIIVPVCDREKLAVPILYYRSDIWIRAPGLSNSFGGILEEEILTLWWKFMQAMQNCLLSRKYASKDALLFRETALQIEWISNADGRL